VPSRPTLSDVVRPITDVDSADSTVPVVNDLLFLEVPIAVLTTAVPIADSMTAAHSTTSMPPEVPVPISTAALPTFTSTIAADSDSAAPILTSLEAPIPASTTAVPTADFTTAANSAVPMTTSLEVPVLVSCTAVLTTEYPTLRLDADAPLTSSLPAVTAPLSTLDDVDTSSDAKRVVRTNAGKKSTRMRPGATSTARCVSFN